MENLFIIGYGLSGGFGGRRNFEVIQVDNIKKAEEYAWEKACEEYESYVGNHGLRTIEDIMNNEEIEDEEIAEEIYMEERESWLDYSAFPYSKEYEKKVMMYHYNNNYSNITDKK